VKRAAGASAEELEVLEKRAKRFGIGASTTSTKVTTAATVAE
jgi:hypothetical protein